MVSGRGAFGKVIRATNKETSESVAIKVIQKKNLDGNDTKNLLTEIKITGTVVYGHIDSTS